MNTNRAVTAKFVLYGDVDGDPQHIVTVNDAYQIAEAVAGLRQFTPMQEVAAEVDGIKIDGENRLTINDAYTIALYVAGSIIEWPIEAIGDE